MKKILFLSVAAMLTAGSLISCGGNKAEKVESDSTDAIENAFDEATDEMEEATKEAEEEIGTTESEVSDLSSSDIEESDSDESVESSSSSNDWDKVLDEYEKFVDKYISLMKKAQAGDMSALAEYPGYMEQATKVSEELSDAEGELTSAQAARYAKILQKMSSAAGL